MIRRIVLSGWLLLSASLAPVSAADLSVFPAADTSLFDIVPTNNIGADPWLVVGRTKNGQVGRSLIRFALTNLAPGTIIEAARVEFEVVRVPQQITPVPSFFTLHRMAQSWSEGNKTGALGQGASPGEPTWLAAAHPATLWSTPGAVGAADSVATPSATTATPVDDFGRYTFPSSPGLVADVQAWVNNPASNHGWLVRSQGEATNATARRIGSREDPAKPVLILTVATPASAQITGVSATNNSMRLVISLPAGQGATVQYRSNLVSGAWLSLTNLAAPPANTNVTVSDAMAGLSNRFYRLTPP
jgi:hypothetical protein